MKLKIQQYSEMVMLRIKNIKKIAKAQIVDDGISTTTQLANELKSLNDLLTNKFYQKELEAERKQLIKQYLEG